jgi:hypothetical protein
MAVRAANTRVIIYLLVISDFSEFFTFDTI